MGGARFGAAYYPLTSGRSASITDLFKYSIWIVEGH